MEMHKPFLKVFFIFLGLISISQLDANSNEEFPVLFKGRYRPAEAYSRLWLYDLYHATKLKSEDLVDFHTTDRSSLSFLWNLFILGTTEFQDAPLFWIQSADVKKSAGFPLKKVRFSYREIHEALYLNPLTSSQIIERLMIYQFLQSYLESPPSTLRLEIPSLLPGMWVHWKDNDLIITRVPPNSPWSFLKPGKTLSSNVRSHVLEITKRDKKFSDEWNSLISSLKKFEGLNTGNRFSGENAYQEHLNELKENNVSPPEIARILEHDHPFLQRLRAVGPLFQSLPSRYQKGEWLSLKALTIPMYDSSTNQVTQIGNFTLFSDQEFEEIRDAYLAFEKSLQKKSSLGIQEEHQKKLTMVLHRAYQPLEGQIYQEAHGKQLRYPSLRQLKTETLYIKLPWIPLLILFYSLGGLLFFASYHQHSNLIHSFAIGCIFLAIICHTGLLAVRCYILGRPPVSNMFETVIYVPWVASCVSLLFPDFRKQPLVLLGACCTSIILLIILEIADLHQSLDQVQAVLDSQFWLTIHVLMVVGSYGIFILGAVIAHFYLAQYMIYRKETPAMSSLAKIVLQTIYAGTTLLVTGTILGGVWAAESWGRFWDWDPKESWAFISCCFYLIWIHAYRFQHIGSIGLSMGAISGLLAISFTWYGVNYILGTGLHSYGFGSGGEFYYFLFIGAELVFLIMAQIRVLSKPKTI